MRKLLLLSVLLITQLVYAEIVLPPGASMHIDSGLVGQTVSCQPGAVETRSLFECWCYNTGMTNNPPPVRVKFYSKDWSTIEIDGRRACSLHNWGRADFGFSAVNDCERID
jgi:hypothetical protein